MSLDVNGYNATFKAFTDFAVRSVEAGKNKAIARVQDGGTVGGHTITAAKHDWVGIGIGRFHTLKDANNVARELFKNAISEMFGGEDKIPKSVQDAMKLEDFGKGKPLTARRIIAIKAAIDADGTAVVRSNAQAVASLSTHAKNIAIEKGYVQSELPKLARAAQFLAEATGVSVEEAMDKVVSPGSKENRLMGYGGRFIENAANFKEGLRLMDLFTSWHNDLCASVDQISQTGNTLDGYDRSSADTPSKMNADLNRVNAESRLGMEKFVFEEIATKPSVNLKEQDAEKIFGFKNNNASRFFGQGFGDSCSSTIAKIPPAKRNLVFKTLNLFCSLAEKPEDFKQQAKNRFFDKGNRVTMISRTLRHFDEIAAMEAKGTLTAKNVIKTCCPDMVEDGKTGNWDIKAVTDYLDNISCDIRLEPEEGGQYNDLNAGMIDQLMGTTGGTLKEVADMLRGGKALPNAKYVSEGQMPLEELGTIEGGRKTLQKDLNRGVGYVSVAEKKLHLGQKSDFGFSFPGTERFVTNDTKEGVANIDKVADKVVELCGSVHPKQSASVMTMMSQSGLGTLKGGLEKYGIKSEEHSVVEFNLSKDANSGEVTIRYASPKELPFSFEWTATVDVEGNVKTTPLRFTSADDVLVNTAKASKAINETLQGANQDNDGIASATAKILESVKQDSDMMALLTARGCNAARSIILDPQARVMSDEEISKRLEALRANVNELRMVAGDNERIFKVGIKQLAVLDGKALPSGTITKLYAAASKADTSALKGLSPDTSYPADILKAMCSLDRIINDVAKETKVFSSFNEVAAQEIAIVNSLVTGFVLTNLDEQSVAGFKDAMYSDDSRALKDIFNTLESGQFPPDSNVQPNVRVAISSTAESFGMNLSTTFTAVLNNALGIEQFDLPPQPSGDDEINVNTFKEVTSILENHVNEVHPDLIPNE